MSAVQRVKESFKIDTKLFNTAYAILNEPDEDKAGDLLCDLDRKEIHLIHICINAIYFDMNSRLK